MSDSPAASDRRSLVEQIRQLGPWHQNIRLTDDFEIQDAFSEQERERKHNNNISLIDARHRFEYKAKLIYPDGLAGKRFLDCACNAGGYCFWARELGAEAVFGFDVRDHWINQARFVQQNRSCAPVDNLQFDVCDLMKLPERGIEPADFTLFKGIFYHLADPILGLKIAADMTREVLWFNSARCFIDNTESLYCTFEAPQNLMSGVHALSWTPSGPSVIAKLLYWLGFRDIRHVFSKENPDRPGFGRMEIMAAREPGLLDRFAEAESAETIDVASYKNARQATDEMKAMF
ncbi:MAG: methyltransferase domain-containing protein [Pirellulaceae bacterium]